MNKNKLKTIATILFINYLITIVWQLLELIIDGKIVPRLVDGIIALLLSISLYKNILD